MLQQRGAKNMHFSTGLIFLKSVPVFTVFKLILIAKVTLVSDFAHNLAAGPMIAAHAGVLAKIRHFISIRLECRLRKQYMLSVRLRKSLFEAENEDLSIWMWCICMWLACYSLPLAHHTFSDLQSR